MDNKQTRRDEIVVDITSPEFENAKLFYANDETFGKMVEAVVQVCTIRGYRIEDVALIAKYREKGITEQMETLGHNTPPKSGYLERELFAQMAMVKHAKTVGTEVQAGLPPGVMAVSLVVRNNRVVSTGGVMIPRVVAEAFHERTGVEIPEEFIEG